MEKEFKNFIDKKVEICLKGHTRYYGMILGESKTFVTLGELVGDFRELLINKKDVSTVIPWNG